MVQPRRHPDLPQEAFRTQGRGELRVEHLERHLTVVLKVAREVHDRHATVPDLALDGVTVLQNRREMVL